MQDVINKIFRMGIPALASAALLSACGGGDTAVAPSMLSGTAAVGLPIVDGIVNVSCAAGSKLTTTTSATGLWQVTMSGQTLPCAVQVNGGKLGSATGAAQTQPYHSIAVSFGTVNVTPLTDLVVANLAQKDPQTWFSGASFTGIDAAKVNTALDAVNTALGLKSQLGTTNSLTTAFQAQNGDAMDDALEAFNTAVAANYTALLAASSKGTFVDFGNFGAAFTTAYGTIRANVGNTGNTGGTSGGSTTCGANEIASIYSGNAGQYTNGQQMCFAASPTALTFAGKTLSNPVQNTVVQAPFSTYKFTDSSLSYEVTFNNGVLHEINVMNGQTFEGQFAPASSTTGTGTGTGAGSLTVETTVAGITSSVVVAGVSKPASQADFCGAMQNDNSLTALTASGGSLSITNCSYSGNVGTITANLVITTPISLSTPYAIKYTYN